MAETIIIKGSADIHSRINVLDEKRPYRADSTRNGQFYYIGTLDGNRGFTCGEEFYKAFKAGILDQVSFSLTTYERKDLVTNQMIARPSASLGGFITKTQKVAMLKGDKELVLAEAELKAAEKAGVKLAEYNVYKEAKIEGEELKMLLQAL